MKQDWEDSHLIEVAKIMYGYTAKAKPEPATAKYLRITDIQNSTVDWDNVPFCEIDENEYSKYYLKYGDILFARTGATTGKSFIIKNPPKAVFASYLIRVQTNSKYILPKFLYQYFQSPKYWDTINMGITGSAQGGFNATKLGQLKIPIPPLDEQKRIVSKLDELFANIEDCRLKIENLLADAKELFQSQLNEIFSQKGDGWVEKELGEVCVLTRGHNPPKNDFIYEPKDGFVRFYQIRDGWSDKYKVYVPETEKLHRVEKDEILMVAYRHIGRRFRGAEGAFNVALCKITNKDKNKLEDDYLFHIIPTDYVRGELLKRSERSLIPSMSVNHLKNIKIPVPLITEQRKMVIIINSLKSKTQALESKYHQELDALDELKKSILQKAFDGELIVEK